MSHWTATDRRLGAYSSAIVAFLALIYLITGIVGVIARPPGADALGQVDPYLAILESLLILVAVGLVVVMAAVHAYATNEKQTYALVALIFTSIFALLTCSVHFVSLTVGRQASANGAPALLQQLSVGKWPSIALSLDLLAWDFFVGLWLLFAAPVFGGDRLRDSLRKTMRVGASLCFVGLLGPLLGHLSLQYVAIPGYAVVMPVACAQLAVVFHRSQVPGSQPQ